MALLVDAGEALEDGKSIVEEGARQQELTLLENLGHLFQHEPPIVKEP